MKLANIVILLTALIAAVFVLWLCYPLGNLFPEDYSTLIFDANGKLLRATLAQDQQYRFPPDSSELPDKYISAVVAFEDKRFFYHPGIDAFALIHALINNIKEGKRIRGGSTIPMQVARLSRPKARSYINKLLECFMALKVSLHLSKDQILRMYADHVPMGGNIVGIRAASYSYFGKPVSELTWAEASLFAVLPNSPAMINLQKKRPDLLRKRNKLISKLYMEDIIDHITRDMACIEPLPESDRNLPFRSPHFTQYILNITRENHIIKTTLDVGIQSRVQNAVRIHHSIHFEQGIPNLAVIVAETETGKIKAYVGSQDFYDTLYKGQVDGIQAYRSTGSLLKPFLIARALDRGPYTISSRIQDIPTSYGTFFPQNASKTYNGLISMERMLIQSLNIPFVRLLNSYGLSDFYDLLKLAGLKGLFRSPQGYGLSLILGGAEANLFELVQLYLSLTNMGEKQKLRAVINSDKSSEKASRMRLFSEGAAWLVVKTLSRLSRPGVEYYFHNFDNHIPVAWKTGTSYGQRDGWAIGMNKQWTIGVWVGNFTGAGNPEISGAKSAAPLLFTLFNMLTRRDQSMWFAEPNRALKKIICCKLSGYVAGPNCPETITLKHPYKTEINGNCPFHRRYLIDSETERSVCSLCWEGKKTEWVNRFIIPPSAREILLRSGMKVDKIPLHADLCSNFYNDHRLEIVYPVNGIKAFIPRDFNGTHEKIVFVAKHHHPSSHLFWFLNGSYLGTTKENHNYPIDLDSGTYQLTVQDEEGFAKSVKFSVYKKMN